MKTILNVNYYDIVEAALMLGKNVKTVRLMIADGRLVANTQTKPFLIPEHAIKAFMEGKKNNQ